MDLHQIQTTVRAAKDKKNDFGGYNYRTAEGILAELKRALPDGAHVIITDDIREVAGQIFVTATATITIGDNVYQAQGHALHALSKKGMDPAQITGSCSSYARKYALAGLLAIDDGSVDPDADKDGYDAFDPATERDRIKHAIEGALTMSGLQKTWGDSQASINRLKSDKEPMYNELVAAKDKRKAELDGEQ